LNSLDAHAPAMLSRLPVTHPFPSDLLVVMSFGNTDALRAEVLALRVPFDRVSWL
jgi:hypothetical protein